MGHEGISIYESLCLREVLYRDAKHKLVVEPVRTHTHTEKDHSTTFSERQSSNKATELGLLHFVGVSDEDLSTSKFSVDLLF